MIPLNRDEINFLKYKYSEKDFSDRLNNLNNAIKGSHKEIKKRNKEEKEEIEFADNIFKSKFRKLLLDN